MQQRKRASTYNVRESLACFKPEQHDRSVFRTKEYLSTVILSPIVDLFNQLRAAAEPLQPFCENSGEDGAFSRVISPTTATLLSMTHPTSLAPWIAMYNFHPAFLDNSIGLISTPVILLMVSAEISLYYDLTAKINVHRSKTPFKDVWRRLTSSRHYCIVPHRALQAR